MIQIRCRYRHRCRNRRGFDYEDENDNDQEYDSHRMDPTAVDIYYAKYRQKNQPCPAE